MKLNPFKNEPFEKGFIKGENAKEKELIPIHKKELQQLADEKDLEIIGLRSELHSMQRRVDYWQTIYRQVTKEKVQNKMDKKELQKIADDVFYFIDQKVIENENLLSAVGEIVSRVNNLQIEGK